MPAMGKNVGTCFLCHQTVNNTNMARHLNDCVKKDLEVNQKEAKATEIFRIKIFADKTFWLYVEMPSHASLQYLDDFLRAIWLECCGHLSEFEVHGVERCNMNDVIQRIFKKGTKFSYEYDFGSTTLLQGEVIDCYQGYLNKKVRLLARNNMPILKCTTCASKPKSICSLCYEFCCTKCVKKHQCDDECMLSVVNSPRMGVCGYEGEIEETEGLQEYLPERDTTSKKRVSKITTLS